MRLDSIISNHLPWLSGRGRLAFVAAQGVLLFLVVGCSPPGAATGGNQPPPPQFVLNKVFPATGSSMQVTVDREVYPPHYAGLWHTHPGPGSLCLLQGTLVIEVRGQADVTLVAGSCWAETAGLAHRPTNQTDQPAVALFSLMAPVGQPRILAAPTPG